jgi:hypothetical protein
MSEQEYKARLLQFRKHQTVHDAGKSWIDMTLAEMEREKQNDRLRLGNRRSSLKQKLLKLLSAIVSQHSERVKGVRENVRF